MLIVDDEQQVRTLVALIIADAGYIPHQAASASEAIKVLESMADQTCLVISDIVMEGMNGIELAWYLRRKYPTLPVVMLTGYPIHTFAEELPEGVEVKTKPFAIGELRAVLAAVCEVAPSDVAK